MTIDVLSAISRFLTPETLGSHQTIEPVATTPPAKSIYLTSAPDSWVSIGRRPNEYVDQDIYGFAGQKLGTIRDVLVGPDGNMAAAIVSVGRFLGIGDKDIAVPFLGAPVGRARQPSPYPDRYDKGGAAGGARVRAAPSA